jgi:hypothetical protein
MFEMRAPALEDAMDIYSLAPTKIHTGGGHRSPMNARAEDSYYASQFVFPRWRPGVLRSIVIVASVIMAFGIALI